MKNNIVLLLLVVLIFGGASYLYLKQNKNGATNTISASKSSIQIEDSEQLSGKPLVTMDGKAIVTDVSLQMEKEKIFKANPQLEKLSVYMNIDESLLQGLTSQAIMDKYIEASGIKNSDTYQNDLNSAYKDVLRMINTKYFSQQYPATISDADVKKFYDENKDVSPNFVISKGGIKTTEVTFDQETQAITFAEKVKTKNGNVLAVAQENNINEDKIKDLRLVNDQSVGVDQAVKDAVGKITQFPTSVVVKTADNKFAVVVATGKEETKYRPYEQIKPQLKEYLEKEKQSEAMAKAIEELKKEYAVIVDESFFEKTESTDEKMSDLGDLGALEEVDDVNASSFGA